MPTRRTHRRCLAILAMLHEEGPLYVSEIEAAIRAWPGTLYAALTFLERDAGLIIGEREDDGPDMPGRVVYRIATKTERAQHAMFGGAGMAPMQWRLPGSTS